jgi:REP element-mobilizing transposase RayT
MPRQSRIDAPGALHHIIARGIARKEIFRDDTDRENFLDRLCAILKETKTVCYAWALIPNHFHLLLRTGSAPIATAMRRLLTGYAVSHNRRHRRYGHLFQNRYKSILCQEDVYLLELVRYIHLNALRAGLVSDLNQLGKYPYSGHGVLMGKFKNDWQDIDSVLKMFDKTAGTARRKYNVFVKKGISKGKRPDLIGGGLIRSTGGWSALKAQRRAKIYQKGDERILGDGNFVEKILNAANETMKTKYALKAQGFDLDMVARRVADLRHIECDRVWAPGKQRQVVEARSLLCYWAVRELGISMASLSRKLNISIPAVSQSVIRGENIAKSNQYVLIE